MSSRSLTSSSTAKGNGNGNGNGMGVALGIGLVLIVILILVSVWGTCTDSGKATFANIKSKFPSLPGLGSSDLRI